MMEMVTMICVLCKNKEEENQSRHLCHACYQKTYRNGTLDNYPKENLFAKRLVKRYGKSILKDFRSIQGSIGTGLTDLAIKYGFSRERSRQIYAELFGKPYTEAKNKKRQIIAAAHSVVLDDLPWRAMRYRGNARKGTASEFLVEQICRSLGHTVIPNRHNKTIDMIINGRNVEVKSVHKLGLTNPRSKFGYYRFCCRKKQIRAADFFILHVVPENRFFVVPVEEIVREYVYIRSTKQDKIWKKQTSVGNLEQYANAWHLLSDDFLKRATGSKCEAVMQ